MYKPIKGISQDNSLVGVGRIALFVGVFFCSFLAVGKVEAATVATPVISPSSGTIFTKDVVTITAVSGSIIYYTTNGTTPTTSSTKYSAPFWLYTPGTYTVKAIATKSGSTNSAVATATIKTINTDAANRATLKTYGITLNKTDCTTPTQTSCTSLNGMLSQTLNEIISFTQACDQTQPPTGPHLKNSNLCGVVITGGTEPGHSGETILSPGNCRHVKGAKFDMRSDSLTTTLSKYILNKTYFTPDGKRSDGYSWYIRKSNNNRYTYETPSTGYHWDVTYPGCVN